MIFLRVAIAVFAAIGFLVTAYAALRLPTWIREIREEDRAIEAARPSRVAQVLEEYAPGDAWDRRTIGADPPRALLEPVAPSVFESIDVPDVDEVALDHELELDPADAPEGHLILFLYDRAQVLEHPAGCEESSCPALEVIETMRLPDGKMQVQGRYREKLLGYERVSA